MAYFNFYISGSYVHNHSHDGLDFYGSHDFHFDDLFGYNDSSYEIYHIANEDDYGIETYGLHDYCGDCYEETGRYDYFAEN